MMGLKLRINDNVSRTIIPTQPRRVALTMKPKLPVSGGGGFVASLAFNDARNSQYIAVIY
jgi:hypothetical protein